MTAYKESGIKWLGKIPAHWEIKPLKFIFDNINEINKNLEIKQILSLVKDVGVILYEDKGDVGNKSKDDLSGYKIARKNDLVLNKMNAVIGSLGVSNYDGLVSPIYLVLRIKNQQCLIRYYSYLFQSKALQKSLRQFAYGIMEIRESIDYLEFKNMYLPLPPLEEQKKIADFLDEKCKKIDDFIAKQTKFIELLKEQKQVLINQATTKGLNKSTELKDTHISHLGKIPTHWEVVKMSFLGSFSKGGKLSRADLTEDGEFSAVLYGDIYTQYNFKIEHCKSRISKDKAEIKADKGDLFFTASGETREDIGKCVAFISDEETYIGGDIIVFKPIDVDSMYLSYFLNNDYSKLIKAIYSKGEIIIHIHQETLKNILIALPPLEEQRKIAKYLDDKCEKIDKAINNITKQISLIQEYKTSLIDTTTKGMLKELF